MYLSWFMAKRFLRVASSENNIKSMLRICFFSIFIGTFALALVAAIMNGFEKETYKKLQGINADLIIRSRQPLDFEKIKNILESKFSKSIKAITPSGMHQLILRNDETELTNLVAIKAIDPNTISNVTTLLDSISQNPEDIKKLLEDKNILLGTGLSQQLDSKVGDPISLLFAQEEKISRNKVTLDNEKANVSGVFKTGIDEFDNNIVVMSLNLFNSIFPDLGITTIELKLNPNVDGEKLKIELQNLLDLNIFSWKDLYPPLVAALVLEKYALIFILALITLVASMNLISLLFMYITQKRVNIAILKSMGMKQKDITAIFIIIGMSLSLMACFAGLSLSWVAVYILNKYPFIKLPDVYYVTQLPAQMDLQINLIVILIVTALSFLASWLPARRTKQINIANILKFESQ